MFHYLKSITTNPFYQKKNYYYPLNKLVKIGPLEILKALCSHAATEPLLQTTLITMLLLYCAKDGTNYKKKMKWNNRTTYPFIHISLSCSLDISCNQTKKATTFCNFEVFRSTFLIQ